MNEQETHLRLGIFVLGGVFLLLAILFFLGWSNIFVKKVKVVTFFTESVQGLSVGSAVKYRGVPVGTVSEISIMIAAKQVRVDMEIEQSRFITSKDNKNAQIGFENFFRKELAQGLRCRLEFVGITGMKYIDFDYFARPDVAPAVPSGVSAGEDSIFISAVPSSFKDISTVMTLALERLSKVKFEEISNELERTLRELSTLVSDPAIKSTIERINDSARNLESSTSSVSRVFSEDRLNELVKLLEGDLNGIEQLTQRLRQDSERMKLPESTAALRSAAKAVVEARRGLDNTFAKFNAAIDSFRELCDLLSADPTSLIGGKRAPKDVIK